MVAYIKSDLEFILEQIKIAEAHAAGQPLYGVGGLIPAYNLSMGLRTVDGSYNHLLPGQEQWGAAGNQFPTLLDPTYRPSTGQVDMDGPGPAPAMGQLNYNPSNNPGSLVFDSSLRTISNLLVDQTLANPAAILTALQRAGSADAMADLPAVTAIYQTFKPAFDAEYQARVVMQNAKAAAEALGDGDPLTIPEAAEQTAIDAWTAATATHAATVVDLEAARVVRDVALEPYGIEMQGDNVYLPAVAPDEGLSAPFNSMFTLFGQFFDHGLDLVNKGGSGTVFVPLATDDPLYVPGSHTNFMVLTRATVLPGQDGLMNTADDIRPVNTTTAYVDQNQTYTSHSSHQVFLREYELNGGVPAATGKLIEGANGGMATWGEVKEQARTILGINLTDFDVGSVPLLRTDAYGNFIPGANGFPQLITGVGLDGIPNTSDDVVVQGNPAALDPITGLPAGISTAGALRTQSAFLADIAHDAVPVGKIADGDITIGLANPGNGDTEYDNELLDAHFIAGDGRVNENIGLTAVHHVFHAEHNRLVGHTKEQVLATNDLAFINQWLETDIAALPATPAEVAALVWDGERLFQAAKFGTEMQYQHLVFEEFARKVQPNINVFLVPDGFDTSINPSIVAEFAHVVYRFGHSMLTESIDRFDSSFAANHIGLIEGFLNPLSYDGGGTSTAHTLTDEIAAGDIIRGMTRQVGNEIDEFVTTALRNNLLGLPLDLATINLARGRDTGVPSLNAARRDFYEATNQEELLKPYDSWTDFAGHLKHEASIINFVAAYGTHTLITGQTTLQGKRDAALTIITGVSVGGMEVPADRLDFLNGLNAYSGGDLGGLENVDLWIGGLAEEIMPFGGMLGSTFNFVFEVQMEQLQSGDRFYYLQRLDGLHLFSEMENNSFAAMIMRNTNTTHLPSDVFSTPGLILEVDRVTRQFNDLDGDGTLENDDPTGTSLLTPLVLRDNPATPGAEANYLRYTGDEHVVLGGTDQADTLIASIGDDTLFGDAGNDRLEGGFGNDIINAGDGDDIIKDIGGDDNIKAGAGHDVVHAGPGLDLVMGNSGQDFIFLGTDMGSEVFAGEGNDFIYGNRNAERILGNEGNDWIETGTFDGAPGDNFDEIFARDSIDGHDVFLGDGGFDEFIAEGGDDIMVGSLGRGKMAGMSGFDWATYKDSNMKVDADFTRGIVFDENPNPPGFGTLDAYESVEGLSGSKFDDVLTGADTLAEERGPASAGGSEGFRGSALTKEGIERIAGLQAVLGLTNAQMAALTTNAIAYNAGEIILGGAGSDTIMGRAGDDIIDGDSWLNVRIAVHAEAGPDGGIGPILTYHSSMTTLAASMFSGAINPGQLAIVREITTDGVNAADVDTARYQGNRSEYAFSATAAGELIVSHAVEDSLDGTDRLRNIERLQFADGNPLNIIVGTAGNDTLTGTALDDLMLGLAGNDVLNGGAGNDILVGGPGGTTTTTTSATYADNFNTNNFGNSTGSATWGPDWAETGDNNSPSNGQIQIDDDVANVLAFVTGDGAQIQRTVNLAGAATASLSYSIVENGLDASDDSIAVSFSRDGVNFVQVDLIDSATNNVPTRTIDLSLFGTGPFTANAAIRFVASSFEAGDSVNIDNLVVNFTSVSVATGVDTLNGGLGDDTYSFSLGDGNDVINEGVSATSGGAADRISILAPSTGIDPVTGLPILTITSLNASDNNGGTQTGDLVIDYTLPTGTQQTITVAGHFTGGNAQTGVERINFNGANFAGYALGADDYLVSRSDPGNRDSGGVNLAASTANNFIVGETGTSDEIVGGSGNDLIFGGAGAGSNDLVGGLGDDLLVGGTGNDDLDARDNDDDDNLDLVGALGADTMVGGAGNDTYGVDDLLDVVVEAANEGTDTVETFMAELSIANMANVENLVYRGADADPFVGTGNDGNNIISGGDLADTLNGGLGDDTLNGGLGNDTLIGGDGIDTLNGGDDVDTLNGGIGNDNLNGGAGADVMAGGADNDTYVVDDAGDVVTELAAGGTDTVQSSISYTLGAELENLTLTGGDDINGTGNALANTINGNGDNNQIFGGGGNDIIDAGNGTDLVDGGTGDDTLSGGTGNDTDTIIGGAGNDTINLLPTDGGNDVLIYNSAGFGNDIVNNFDANATGGQDLINLSALGITAANLATRVIATQVGANVVLNVRDASLATIGTIQVNNTTVAAIDATDYILSAAPTGTTINGNDTGQTHTGTANGETINAAGGNDIVNALGGNDVVNGGEGADTLNGGDGNDTLSGGTGSNSGTYVDAFGTASYSNSNGTVALATSWIEGGGETTSPTAGDITISGGRLQFNQNVDGGETIERAVNLTGATAASVTFAYEDDNLGAGQSVIVQARNVNTNAWETLTGGTLGSTTGNGNGTFNATLTANQIGSNSAIRFLTAGDGNNWDNSDNFYIDNFTVNLTAPGLNAGADTASGGTGDDTIVWNANAVAPTDGRDIVDGGTEGAAGDTFVINGNTSSEVFNIYTLAAWDAVVGNDLASFAGRTPEIVITRNGTGFANVIAELSEIEEIRINSVEPTGTNGGAGAGDTFNVIGDFAPTSLRLNTITIDGDDGDDMIDISALTSAHRIVFKSNGGNDTIIGALQAEDVIELPADADPATYHLVENQDGTKTVSNGTHSVTFSGVVPSQFQTDEPDEDEDENETPHDDDEETPTAGGDDEETTATGVVRTGTAQTDTLVGTAGDDHIVAFAGDDIAIGDAGEDAIVAGEGADFVSGGSGRDVISAGAGDDHVFAGADADMVYGDAGADRIFGEQGNDLINAGAGDDTVFGGAGNDLIVAEAGDGNDAYFGDEGTGGSGIDTLDMSATGAAATVNLGSGPLMNGSASSSLTGNDTLWGIENVNTGSGNDVIVAGTAANVMNGGLGGDTFVFSSVEAAKGDTIVGFEPGDRIDLSGIDANYATDGNQSFTLVSDAAFTAAGQLAVTYETRNGEDFTVVQGNVDGNAAADFKIEIAGHQNLGSNVTL
ncbi:hypothetical protein JQ629_01040 [Bradyrhizobium sp. AUGA SZCCT0222]|uniref:peroxidase family protein n=1 Tax=Bradyrhizobium sp. AUGA SZCCT0222 TaxID=2807668 RepID=UPI001BA7B454|nr:peroxidase family protein [Bradyrhizobium sp. AUGA SZCCT0222]MBR1266089.1 hypothetical protein [Bradyrhizobium sp. AUGA SZCCT0222]